MKTKRISKLLGWGLSIAVVLSLGLAALPVGAQGEMEWAEVTTPTWDDNVIVPGADIYDYAIGSDDGSIVYAVGEINPVSGMFTFVAGGTVTLTATADPDVAMVSCRAFGDTSGLSGDYTAVGIFGEKTVPIVGLFAATVEVVDNAVANTDEFNFDGYLYATGISALLPTPSTAPVVTGTVCVDNWNLEIDSDDVAVTEAWLRQPKVWMSDDGGVTWDDITETVQEDTNNLPGAFIEFQYGGVAVAPDDEDWVAIAGTIFTPTTPWASAVVASQDGGGEFTYAGDIVDTANGTAMDTVYDLAISPEVDDIHNIAVAGMNDASDGSIFRLEAGTWLSGTWEDTSFYDGWDDNMTGSPLDSWVVSAVEFSPNFDLDVSILCMTVDGTGPPLPYLQSGIWESGGTWNGEADFANAVQITDDGVDLWTWPVLRVMGFALPADYDGSDPGARNIYVYVDAQNSVTGTVGGTVVMVEDDSLSPRCGPSGDPLLASIDVYGDADSCKAMVGTYVDWEQAIDLNLGDPIPFDCCEGVAVYHTVELDYCCPDWDGACKDPSGPYTAVVAYTPDGEKAYATTNGVPEPIWCGHETPWGASTDDDDEYWGGLWDESAFSVSLDDGNSFNQIGLIDTDIDFISDVAVCPDCETAYISTINQIEAGDCWLACDCSWDTIADPSDPTTWAWNCREPYEMCPICDCDSIWRSWTKDGDDIGDVWERVYHGDWSDAQADALLLRLPVDDLEDCCTLYMGIQNSNDLFYTRDCGQCWNSPPATKIEIQDIAVETENVVYVLDSDGYVSKSTQYGRRPSDEVDTEAGSGHTIFVMPDDMVIIGGSDGDSVAWSDDGGETWTVMDDIEDSSDGTIHVIFDHICDDIVYAAVDGCGGSIYRGYMSTGEWETLNAFAYGYYGIALGRSDGTLYAASNNINVDTTSTPPPGLCDRFVASGNKYYSGVARNLTPCETDCCDTEDWDYLISGLGEGPDEWFDNEPSALRICGCTTIVTNTVLWAIDADAYEVDPDDALFPDGALWAYEDCASKVGPTLLSPADEAVLDCDPCLTCEGIPFTLKWERMCVGCSWDIEIMDEDGNLIIDWLVDEYITTDPPEFYLDDEAIQCGRTYTWHVRLADTETDECVHSPWSDTWSFTIAASAADAVSLIAPDNGDMGIQISSVPFSWSSVSSATSYSFVLSPNSDLSGALASEELSGTAYEYTGSLDYLTPYYWQVTAWKDGTALSQSVIGAFTTVAKAVPAPEPPEPAPAPVVNIPPTQMITPTWIYAIIGIGAALAVVVIVLIVRTRRP